MSTNKLSNFYVRSSLFTVLSLLGALINYALYPVLAHILNTSNFGNFTVILALSNQILAILLSFNILSIALVKNYSESTAQIMVQTIQKVLMRLFLLISVVVLILSPFLKHYLKIDNTEPFFVLTLLLLINVPIVIWSGYLQGHKRMINVGFYTFFSALMKFIFALILGIKFGAIGALWGVVIGTVAGVVALWISSDIKLPKVSTIFIKIEDQDFTYLIKLRKFILNAIFVVGGIGILQNIDIIYAKIFFNRSVAGIYSGVSILSNAIFYITFLLIWIILPEIDINNDKNNKRIITTSYKLIALLSVFVIISEIILKNVVVNALLGHNFPNQGNVLIFTTLFQISLSSVAIYAFYLLVLRSTRSFWISLSIILPCLIFPHFFHKDTLQMIISLFSAVLFGVSLYFIISEFKRLRKHYASS